MKRLGKDAVMRPLSGEEETSAPVPKPANDNKRKRSSTAEDPKLKRTARAGPEALRTEENAPSDSLGAIVIGDSPILPAFSEGAIRKARALGTLEVDEAHEGEDPFCDLFIGIEDAAGPSDVSGLFFKVQRTLNRALALHQEEFSKSRTELSRHEADFRGLSEERNALKLLNGQKVEEIKDLQAELAKAYQDQTDLTEQIHARGFNLTEEIKKAKDLEADARALASDDDDDDDDDDGSKSGSESREEPDGEETALGDNQET
ncbi:uncharacterized protein [Nicotiana tomentosiformis]|uniref:uncharacterized protein n=1 Tax=Nicotiana tomentosiformis TaxID=4098 RepID=UPI00388C7C4A